MRKTSPTIPVEVVGEMPEGFIEALAELLVDLAEASE